MRTCLFCRENPFALLLGIVETYGTCDGSFQLGDTDSRACDNMGGIGTCTYFSEYMKKVIACNVG